MSVPIRFGCSKNCKFNYFLRFYVGLPQSAKIMWKINKGKSQEILWLAMKIWRGSENSGKSQKIRKLMVKAVFRKYTSSVHGKRCTV